MASITKHKDGYRAQVYVSGQRDSAVRRTKREAEVWAAARETELRALAAALPGVRHTLGDALQRYSDEVSPTKRGCRWEQIRIAVFLRDDNLPCGQAIGRLTTPQLADWRDARLRQVSAGSVLREIGILAAVLETARREWRWISVNPMADMRKPKAPEHRSVVISRREVRLMLREMGYSSRKPVRSMSQAVAVCFLVALRTGMRAGELCGLRWDLVHDGYCTLPVTKTKPRDVPLTAKAMALIRRMDGWDGVLVFGVSPQSLDALFRKYRKRAGLEGFTFHDSRHTAATWIAGRMKSSNIPAQQAVFDMCKMFGWSSVDQALAYYNPSAKDIALRIG